MTKKKNQKSNPSSKPKQKSAQNSFRNWRKMLEKGFFTLAILVMVGFVYTVYSSAKATEQDLSVIGNGVPTVVQVHDPGCQLCRRLKKNLDSVASDFKPDVQFKIANIRNEQGRQFAQTHDVPHVTLLFFDETGNRVETIQGVTPAADIRQALSALVRNR